VADWCESTLLLDFMFSLSLLPELKSKAESLSSAGVDEGGFVEEVGTIIVPPGALPDVGSSPRWVCCGSDILKRGVVVEGGPIFLQTGLGDTGGREAQPIHSGLVCDCIRLEPVECWTWW
jgi:hypothetical protein